MRLDQLLVELGLVESRQKAQARIMAGEVLVNDVPCTKAGTQIKPESEIRLKGENSPYVGRGGEKLEGALEDFNLSVVDLIGLDVGASTGGFTDCLLQKGAQLVYAIDVGTNQLAHKIRIDSRVRCYEKTHVKDLSLINFDPKPNFIVIDVSFISLKKVVPFIIPCIENGSKILALIKPQFELSSDDIGKGGVVKDEKKSLKVLEDLSAYFETLGLVVVGSRPSTLKGRKSGNQEYFMLLTYNL